MSLSKRPKGPEIDSRIQDQICDGFRYHNLDEHAHSNMVGRVKKLESDLALLMAHLKLEFREIQSVPGKRVVGKATKKKKPSAAPIGPTTGQYLDQYYRAAQNTYPWGR